MKGFYITKCYAKLLDGTIVEYDFCNCTQGESMFFDMTQYQYLGRGRIYKVGNKIQNFKDIQHFYKRKTS